MPASRPSRLSAPKPPASRSAPAPASSGSGLTEAQRVRVRKLVRWALVPVILVQAVLVTMLFVPDASAFASVVKEVTGFRAIKGFGAGNTLAGISSRVREVRNEVRDVEAVNRDILDDTNDLVEDARLHSRKRDSQVNTFQTADVSTQRMQQAFRDHAPNATGGGLFTAATRAQPLNYFGDDPAGALARIAPGATAWENRHADMVRADDAALMTLRAGMASLKSFHENMQEDDARFRDLMQQARDEPSRLAVAQLQVEANMEVARQLQALRAQQALQSNLDIVTATREISEAARNNAHVAKGNCEMMTQMIGDGLGGIVGAGAEALSARAFCVE